MNDSRKLFNGQGFLTDEGKAFVNDCFVPGLKRVLSTAQNIEDTQTIGAILKSIVGEAVSDQYSKIRAGNHKVPLKLVRSSLQEERLPNGIKASIFPEGALALIKGLSDAPSTDQE